MKVINDKVTKGSYFDTTTDFENKPTIRKILHLDQIRINYTKDILGQEEDKIKRYLSLPEFDFTGYSANKPLMVTDKRILKKALCKNNYILTW